MYEFSSHTRLFNIRKCPEWYQEWLETLMGSVTALLSRLCLLLSEERQDAHGWENGENMAQRRLLAWQMGGKEMKECAGTFRDFCLEVVEVTSVPKKEKGKMRAGTENKGGHPSLSKGFVISTLFSKWQLPQRKPLSSVWVSSSYETLLLLAPVHPVALSMESFPFP